MLVNLVRIGWKLTGKYIVFFQFLNSLCCCVDVCFIVDNDNDNILQRSNFNFTSAFQICRNAPRICKNHFGSLFSSPC